MTTLLTTQQTAEYCSISPRTLESWRASGQGPRYRKIGRLVRYEQFDVEHWLSTLARVNSAGNPTSN